MGLKGFVEGGLASIIAGCTTHPLDLVKVRMQLEGTQPTPRVPAPIPSPAQVSLRPAWNLNMGGVARAAHIQGHLHHHHHSHSTPLTAAPGPVAVAARIVRAEGPRALFSGVSATMLRQCLYSTTRMGLYDVLKQRWSSSSSSSGQPQPQLPIAKKIAAGLVAGAVGAAVGNPADVAMVRMQADGRLPAGERRNYAGVGDALARMVRSEGPASLWRGSALTVQRAMVVTAAQLATYDSVKEGIGGDGIVTHVGASGVAGFVAAVASNPIDVVKTRVMNAGQGEYSGALDCLVKTVRSEGPGALYKGFLPTVMRQGPFTVVLFVSLEQIRRISATF